MACNCFLVFFFIYCFFLFSTFFLFLLTGILTYFWCEIFMLKNRFNAFLYCLICYFCCCFHLYSLHKSQIKRTQHAALLHAAQETWWWWCTFNFGFFFFLFFTVWDEKYLPSQEKQAQRRSQHFFDGMEKEISKTLFLFFCMQNHKVFITYVICEIFFSPFTFFYLSTGIIMRWKFFYNDS